jgi:hypothetical protein
MNYAVEMGSVSLIYMPRLIEIFSAIQKLIGGYTYRHTGTQTAM